MDRFVGTYDNLKRLLTHPLFYRHYTGARAIPHVSHGIEKYPDIHSTGNPTLFNIGITKINCDTFDSSSFLCEYNVAVEDISVKFEMHDINVHKTNWLVSSCFDAPSLTFEKSKQVSPTVSLNTKTRPHNKINGKVKAKKSYVYFIRADDKIKIGISNNPQNRVATLQTGSAVPLEIVGIVNGGRTKENELHNHFSHLRQHGEWFEAAPELLAYIEENAKVYQ